jgi:hypothetical protein
MKNLHKFLLTAAFGALALPAAISACSPTAGTPCTTSVDCPTTGETVCNTETKLCVIPCDVAGGECLSTETCGADKFCTGGAVGTTCTSDSTCLATQELCDLNTGSANNGKCAEPDTVTGNCAEATKFSTARQNNGPLIGGTAADAEFKADTTIDADCATAGAGAHGFTMTLTFSDPDGDNISDNTAAFNAFKWADGTTGPLGPTLPCGVVLSADANVVVCGVCFDTPPAGVAMQYADQAGNLSNVACSLAQ